MVTLEKQVQHIESSKCNLCNPEVAPSIEIKKEQCLNEVSDKLSHEGSIHGRKENVHLHTEVFNTVMRAMIIIKHTPDGEMIFYMSICALRKV